LINCRRIYQENMEKRLKCAFRQKRKSRLAQRIKEKAHPTYKFGPSTDMGMIQAHLAAHNTKSVARGCVRTPTTASRAHVA
jgi:hypothetical protein